MDEERRRTLTEGDAGATRVCAVLTAIYDHEITDALEKLGIVGADIWILYNDECHGGYREVAEAIRDGTAMDKLRRNPCSRFFDHQ